MVKNFLPMLWYFALGEQPLGCLLPFTNFMQTRRLSNVKETLREIFGEDVANSAPQIWGLNKEGEKMGVFKEIGYKGLYVMMGMRFCARVVIHLIVCIPVGDLSVSRFYSKHVAFRESIFKPYL